MSVESLELIVLGSAAGGGFPQWNCACVHCTGARREPLRFEPRTQDSLAVGSRQRGWFLCNAAPDVTRQIQSTELLWPREPRHSPIRGVVLTNGDLDHVLGLFQLREWHPLSVYATERVRAGLEQNVMLRTLSRFREQIVWRTLNIGQETQLLAADGLETGIRIVPVAAPGKPPLHLVDTFAPAPEDNVGLCIFSEPSRRAVYLSATASLDAVPEALTGAQLLLLDGTFWSDDEPSGFGAPLSARAMGHVPIGGAKGSLRALERLDIRRRLYTHVNNSNPILDAHSEERRIVESAGWEVARDGLHFRL